MEGQAILVKRWLLGVLLVGCQAAPPAVMETASPAIESPTPVAAVTPVAPGSPVATVAATPTLAPPVSMDLNDAVRATAHARKRGQAVPAPAARVSTPRTSGASPKSESAQRVWQGAGCSHRREEVDVRRAQDSASLPRRLRPGGRRRGTRKPRLTAENAENAEPDGLILHGERHRFFPR